MPPTPIPFMWSSIGMERLLTLSVERVGSERFAACWRMGGWSPRIRNRRRILRKCGDGEVRGQDGTFPNFQFPELRTILGEKLGSVTSVRGFPQVSCPQVSQNRYGRFIPQVSAHPICENPGHPP